MAGRPRFDPARGTVRALLFTIARRVAVDLLRRPSSRAFAPELEDVEGFDALADEVLLAVIVRDAMVSLSPAHREVLELVYDEDLKLGRSPAARRAARNGQDPRLLRAARDANGARERGLDG